MAKDNEPAQIPIAVVGMACRVPGADGLSEFWRLLMDGVCTVEDAPRTRFNRPYGVPGTTIRAGLLDGVDRFDAEFFGISPREAMGMDPQQRLFLETAWEALEDGGQDTAKLAGTRTGVYVGTCNVHYWDLLAAAGNPDMHASLGSGSRATMTGRLSFALDVNGPGLSVDAACSSSLAAIALACQSLRAGESAAAIAGGSQLLIANTETQGYVDAGVFSAENCKFGDASADGFVFSEGVGAVFLKPLAQALADGDPVRAVIRGWGMNNDGADSGTMISPALGGQRQMLLRAYENAGVPASEVDYIEAHGTGTPAGDPVELGAIGAVLGAPGERADDRPLLVGSVKSNIGHTGSAAGVLGLIKAVLVLKHRTVPPTLHVTEPTPAVEWDGYGLELACTTRQLTAEGRPLTAGVSGFGISGTNVHLVVSEPDPAADTLRRRGEAAPAETGREHLLALSAASREALRARASDLAEHLQASAAPGAEEATNHPGDLADICHTAAVRRAHHGYRLAVVGDSRQALAGRLREVLEQDREPVYAGSPRVAFVFSGHGSQWVGMGRELMAASPAFRAALERCDEAVRTETGWSVTDRLTDGTDLVAETVAVVHPVLWALQVSLAETWRAWGVEPDVVIGHSMGESAAACVSGALSLADAASVVCRRARLIRDRVAGRGTMAVIALAAEEAVQLIRELAVNVSVAASNGPRTTVLAGEVEGIEKIKAELDVRDVFCRVMKAEAASHCSQMDPVLDELAGELAQLAPRTGRIPLRSTVTGELLDGSGLDASYWTRNLRGRVHFREAVLSTAQEAETVFVEISPHPVLLGAIQESLQEAELPGTATGSLVRAEPERETLLSALGAVYEAGVAVDWTGLYGEGRCVDLPAYPWQRESHWYEELDEDASTGALRDGMAGPPQGERIHEFPLGDPDSPFLADAPAHGPALLHGPAFAEAARVAAARAAGTDALRLADVSIADALVVAGDAPVLRVRLTPAEAGWRFEVTSRPGKGGAEGPVLCDGAVTVPPASPAPAQEPVEATLARCPEHWDADAFYGRIAGHKELYRVLDEVWLGRGEAVARLRRPAGLRPHPDHPVHPALLTAASQPALALLPDMSYLTEHAAEVAVHGPDAEVLWSRCRITDATPDGLLHLDMALLDEGGRVVAEVNGMRMRRAPAPAGDRNTADALAASKENDSMTAHLDRTPSAAARQGADSGIELTGQLRLTDPSSGFVIELQGSLRISLDQAPGTAAAPAGTTVPVPVAAPFPAPRPAPSTVSHALPSAAPETAPAPGPASDDRPMADRVAEQVAAVLRTRVAKLDVNKPLHALGMDSLMATELRKRLENHLGTTVPLTTLARGTTTAGLARALAAHTAA
ncbi:acyltransferase domain-containing protein [Streptomyces sp. NPDC001250]|uniref:type I polyketide synthase n=1 Tax=unclassified Streptomyces TaxID=2593676 RepID=UPI003316FBED